ncbi:MAG: methyltransferase domain-containing protein [Candidatus Sericytochromatia bacterium]
MGWNPEQYEKFKTERFAPFQDLLALIDKKPNLTFVDLGCGTGELTARLQEALPESRGQGFDSSEKMLKQAEVWQNEQLQFEQKAIEVVSAPSEPPWDLVFSHAALQWVDDHPSLFANIWQQLKPGGQLAVQMPANHSHLTHRLLTEMAAEEPFYSALQGWHRHSPVLGLEAYAQLLFDLGAETQVVMEKVYPHVLADATGMVEWVKGTALVPYLDRLSPELQSQWLETYTQRLQMAYPQTPVFYGFRRLLIWASKPL